MLTGHKYVALINNYDTNLANTCKQLENLTALDLFSYALRHQQPKQSNQLDLKIPKSLKIYTFDNGLTNSFPSPTPNDDNLLSFIRYYCRNIKKYIENFSFYRLLLYGRSIYFTS